MDPELNQQFPGRELQKAQTSEGLRDGWAAVQAARDAPVTNTPPAGRRAAHNTSGGDDWHPTVGDCARVILEEE